MTHLSFRDQGSAEAYYKLNLKQIQPIRSEIDETKVASKLGEIH